MKEKAITYRKMSKEYQDRYEMMRSAREAMELAMRHNTFAHTLEIGYLQNRIVEDSKWTIGRYYRPIPTVLKHRNELPEKDMIFRMDHVTRGMRGASLIFSDSKDNDFNKICSLTDRRAFLFEAGNVAKQASNLCRADINVIKAMDNFMVMAAGKDNMINCIKKVQSHVEELGRYFAAVDDFSDGKKSTNDFPEAVFNALFEVCSIRTLLQALYFVDTSDRIPKHAEPTRIDDVMHDMLPLYQIAQIEIISGKKMYDDKHREFADAVEEMIDILTHSDNFTGYHINHITNGKEKYFMMINRFTDDEQGMEFDQKGPYDTEENAKEAQKELKLPDSDVSIYKAPTESWYSVVQNSSEEAVAGCAFDTQREALAALYILAKPASYETYKASQKEDA